MKNIDKIKAYKKELEKWLEVPLSSEHGKGFHSGMKTALERFNLIFKRKVGDFE